MKLYFKTLFSIVALFTAACNGTAEKNTELLQDSVATTTSKLDISGTDSMEVYYFPDAKNQKVFIRHLVSDSSQVNSFLSQLKNPQTGLNACDNNFKMFLYNNGDVYKTLYAATADSCNYLAYIINGVSYFSTLTDSASAFLYEYK